MNTNIQLSMFNSIPEKNDFNNKNLQANTDKANKLSGSSVSQPRLGKEVRFSPFLGEQYHASAPVVPGSVGSKNVKNLNAFSDPQLTIQQVEESEKVHQNIAKRYHSQNIAKKILYQSARENIDNDPNFSHLSEIERHYKAMNSHNTIKCFRTRSRSATNVGVRVDHEHSKAFFTGTHVCSSVWACKVCSTKINVRRGTEVQIAYDWAYNPSKREKEDISTMGKTYQVALITFTAPHSIDDTLEDFNKKFDLAHKYLRKGENYDKYKKSVDYQGVIKSKEVTYGDFNGWHPHSHEGQIISFNLTKEKEAQIRKFILNEWKKACKKAGLLKHGQTKDFEEHAVDIIFHSKASNYIAKMGTEDEEVTEWGADAELTGSINKLGKIKGLSPWQLLERGETSEKYKALWLEYAFVMKGKKQLVWSRGLKEKVGLKDKSDEEVAKEQTSSADLLALLTDEQWRIVLRIDPVAKKKDDRAYILWLAVNAGFQGLSDYFKDHKSILLTVDEIDLNVNIKILEDIQEKQADREQAKKTKPSTVPIEPPPVAPPMTAEEVLKMYDERYFKIS